MTFWGLVQIFINIVLLAGIGFLWAQLNRPAKDDPRMSKGLQLLSSKISILEDLSDRTEVQVKQLTALIEQKCREIQKLLQDAENQISKIETSRAKSLEVAKIFQDKIPHQEIIERQNTLKYIKAARMAHAGESVDNIAAAVDLPRGEVEFIAKVNRDQLQFSEEELPAWAKESDQPIQETSPIVSNSSQQSTLSALGDQFRRSLDKDLVSQLISDGAEQFKSTNDQLIQKVEFPRI